jgi:glyoxylase-like metal-dependent hydrolase (beta-lactamase superfamily II)
MDASALPVYELYAIRYAQRDAMRSSHFMGGDAHDGPMPMDYFVWVAVAQGNAVMIDIGFTQEAAQKRKREFLCDPIESLRLVDVDPASVNDVVITHMHYDHAGNFHLLPNARFHLQEPEMHFASGRHMRHRYFSSGYETEDVVQAIRLNFAGRMLQYNGEAEIVPGIRVVPTPGHSPGEQVVCVHTQRGWVVVASDASHYYENLIKRRPYPAAHHVDEMIESFEKVMKLAGGDIARIIPGHDPIVMQIYPAARPGLEGRVARLDVQPAPMPERPSRKPSA